MMLGSATAIILLLGPIIQEGAAFTSSFVTLHRVGRATIHGLSPGFSSSLNYNGPHRRNDERDEDANEIVTSFSSSSSSLSSSEVASPPPLPANNHLDNEQTIRLHTANDSNYNEDPLCDFEDVDCRAFLPRIDTSTYPTTVLPPSDTYLAAQLKTRSESIQRERMEQNWKVAHCPTSFVSVSNSDYIRRVNMETYPIAVCGGARGGLYVINLETKNVIGKAEGVHISQVVVLDEQPGSSCSSSNRRRTITRTQASMAKEAMEKLYGKLDGGGVVAVAIHGDFIASSGREGGVRLWKMDHSIQDDATNLVERSIAVGNNSLVPLGTISGLDHTIVTCLKFDSNDRLWIACFDGTIRAYNMVEYYGLTDTGVFPSRIPLFQSDFTDSVLDMHLCEELQLGVCATADGGAALFHMNDGQFFAGIILSEVAARSVLIMKHRNRMEYSVLCGTSDGFIHSLPLNVDSKTGTVDEENPFRVSETAETTIQPRHVGPVMCMTSPGDGIFVSGGQDGALRVWNCADERYSATGDAISEKESTPNIYRIKCMYALTGYKLWLASVCTDGKRLVSDGGENSVIVRDFSSEPRTNGKASYG